MSCIWLVGKKKASRAIIYTIWGRQILCGIYFDANQRFIGKIARLYCKNMDFLTSHGSNMGEEQCYGVDILPNYIHLACQMW